MTRINQGYYRCDTVWGGSIKCGYKIVNTKNQGTKPRQRAQDLPVLNSNGADGWELCGVHGTMYFFKKEIRE